MNKYPANKIFLAALLTVVLLTTSLGLNVQHVMAFSDVSNMSDASFFGVWNGSTWSTAGKINYSYGGGALSAVEGYAKAGNYSAAKSALLTYYQNRTSRTVVPMDSSIRNTEVADLVKDDIFSMGDIYMGTLTLGNTYHTVSLDVLDGVEPAMASGKIITFMVMGRMKASGTKRIYSREQAVNKPTLEVVINGQTYTLPASKDTYTRAGTYGNTNYGTSAYLDVRGSGYPYDNNESRAFITFDMSGLSGTPSSAVLKLYGANASATGNEDVMVYKVADSSYGETSLTWNTTLGLTFSWQGSANSTDWNNPTTGAYVQYVNNLCINKFLLQLAYEYAVTSDTSYSDKAVSLMLDFISDKGNSNPGYDNALDCSRREVNWIAAYDYIIDSGSMDAGANTAILKYTWQLAEWLADPNYVYPTTYGDMVTSHFCMIGNGGVMESKALYYLSVYYPEFTNAGSWKSLADQRVSYMIQNVNYPDSSYTEATSSYQFGVLTDFYSIKQFAALNHQTLPPVFDDILNRMAWYSADRSTPSGYDIHYGDSGEQDRKPLLSDIADSYNDSGLKYFASGGASGTALSRTSILYPCDMSVTMRSGWNSSALSMQIDNKIFDPSGTPRGHRHHNLLALIVNAFGKTLLPDNGSNGYDNDPITLWLRTSEAHNTIQIDNLDQKDTGTTNIRYWRSNPYADFYEGYSTAGCTTGTFSSYRSVLFVKPDYWIVSDYVDSASGTHRYEQNWHMMPGAGTTMDATTKASKSNFAGEPNIQVVPADPASLSSDIAGSYNQGGGSLQQSDRIVYAKTGTQDATFDTVLYPTASGDTGRNVTVTRLATSPGVAADVATALEINLDNGNNGNKGYYYLSHEASPAAARSFGSYNYDGKVAYVETDSFGSRETAILTDGKTLKENGANLISSPTKIKDITVKWKGTTLDIYGSNLAPDTYTGTAAAIYAPSVTTVRLNGSIIPYNAVGNNIYAVRDNTAPRNVASSGTMSATSSQGSYPPSKANDADTGTFWVSSALPTAQTPQYLTCDLGSTASVSRVNIYPRVGYGPQNIAVEVSTDGSNYVQVAAAVLPNTEGPHSVLFDPVDARYVRLRIATSHNAYNVQIKEFEIYANQSAYAKASFNGQYFLNSGDTGQKTIEYDVTPLGYKINGVIGYADSSTAIDDWIKMSVIVRTNLDGYFDAINGAAYAAQANIPYIANGRYHVRIVVDLGAGTYDVYITPPDGTETMLANDYVFRAGAPGMSNIGKLFLHTDNNDELLVENHKVY